MGKSFISFKTHYPNWEPDGNGKQFMSVLADFRIRNEENDLAMGQLFSSVRLPQPPNQLRPWGQASMPGNPLYTRSFNSAVRDRFGPLVPFARPPCATGASSDVLQRSVTENSDQIYWLDKFYTASQSQQNLEAGVSPDTVGFGSTYSGVEDSSRVDDIERLGMHVQASSTRGILGNQGFGQGGAAGESRWWARRGPGESTAGAAGESSFEPPLFAGRPHIAESQDDFYESEEDHERDAWSSQRHTRGTFGSRQISEEGSPPLEFPFGDVYERPREDSSSARLNPGGGPAAPADRRSD